MMLTVTPDLAAKLAVIGITISSMAFALFVYLLYKVNNVINEYETHEHLHQEIPVEEIVEKIEKEHEEKHKAEAEEEEGKLKVLMDEAYSHSDETDEEIERQGL